MQILELQHDRHPVLRANSAEHLSHHMEGPVPDLPRVVADAADVRARAEVEPEQVTQYMSMAFSQIRVVAHEQLPNFLFDLVPGSVQRLVIGNSKPRTNDVA